MQHDAPAHRSAPTSSRGDDPHRRASAVSLVIAAVLAALLGAGAAIAIYVTLTRTKDGITVRPTPSVVVAMHDLAKLETTRYHMERIVDLRDKQSRLYGLIEAEDAIRLHAVGDVIAGVDLSKLSEADVQVDEKRRAVVLYLPKAEILSATLDSDRTVVFDRDTALLARRNEGLETRARQEAERTIREAALEAGILARAEAGAKTTLRSFITSLGYQHVDIRVR